MGDDQLLNRFGRELAEGVVLFREGDPGNEMFVLQQGRVTISKDVGGADVVLTTLGPGEFFGEMSILCHRPRSATATVIEKARLLVLDSKTFDTMIRSHSEIAIRMIRKLAERLQSVDDQITKLLLREASSRVVHALVRAAERVGRATGAVTFPVQRGQLAAWLHVEAREAEETLVKLTALKLVAFEADAFVILDVERLRDFLRFLLLQSQFGSTG